MSTEARPPELVIFDCDGVLVDSEPISAAVLARALSSAGLLTSASQALDDYKGLLLSEAVARAEERLGAALAPGFAAAFERDRTRELKRSLRPIAEAAVTVEALRAAGVSVCVASQGKLEKTELTLTLTGLRPLFGSDALFSAYSVARGKPHPDLFLHAARVMGVSPGRSVVVEDTTIGVQAAVAAGMRAFGYAADGDAQALRAAGAETIGSLAELPARIGIAASASPSSPSAASATPASGRSPQSG